MYNIVARTHRHSIYDLGPDGIAVVQRATTGRPAQSIAWRRRLVDLVAAALNERGQLFRAGETPVILGSDRRPRMVSSPPATTSALEDVVICACMHEDTDHPQQLAIPASAHDDDIDRDERWERICRANGMSMAYLKTLDGGLWLSTLAESSLPIPTYHGRIARPVVGEVGPGWFPPPAPAEPHTGRITATDGKNTYMAEVQYPYVTQLFSTLPLDPVSHAVLYTYLFSAFHADSLTLPAPLLVIDSWERGVGKTEAAAALSIILDGESASLTPPKNGDTDVLVAHMLQGRSLVVLDNLTGANWNHPWVASLLTDRHIADRPKYSRLSVTFSGRLVATTFVFGSVTLHPDLLARTWRVELHGHAAELAHRPNRYAREHRAAILAECYHAVRAAPEWRAGSSGTRAHEVEARGAATYAAVFSIPQCDVHSLLREGQKRVRGLSTDMLTLYQSRNIELPDGSIHVRPHPLAEDAKQALIGATGLGFRVDRDAAGGYNVVRAPDRIAP